MGLPTTRRLYRSMRTARYRKLLLVRMYLMPPGQQRLVAAGVAGATWPEPTPVLALIEALCMGRATRWRATLRTAARISYSLSVQRGLARPEM
jgi:hypothetical protein